MAPSFGVLDGPGLNEGSRFLAWLVSSGAGRGVGWSGRRLGGGVVESARLDWESQCFAFTVNAEEPLAAESFQIGWQQGPCGVRVLDNAHVYVLIGYHGKKSE